MVSHLVSPILLSTWFDGVWCLFRDVGTLGITQLVDVSLRTVHGVGPLEGCAIHPTHPVHLVTCTSEP